MKRIYNILFFTAEGILLLMAAYFFFGKIKITVYIYISAALAAFVGVCHLICWLSTRQSRGARVLRIALSSMLLIGFLGFAVLEILIISGGTTDKNPEADYVIVLGAGINGSVPSQVLHDRLVTALDYLTAYPDSVAVVSGGQGQGEDITEAECMRRWLEEKGVAPGRIIKEEESTSTMENITFSLKKIAEAGGDPCGKVAIVSNEFHLYRAKLMAKALGACPAGVAADTSNPVLMINYFIREAPAVAVMLVS